MSPNSDQYKDQSYITALVFELPIMVQFNNHNSYYTGSEFQIFLHFLGMQISTHMLI